MKLRWTLMELEKYQGDILMLDDQADLTNSLKERKRDLFDASPVDVQGAISIDNYKRYYVDLTLHVTFTLPSSRSLEPVELELTVPFSEVYLTPDANRNDMDDLENDIVFSLDDDFLDLQKPIEDTLLAAIPMKVLSKEEQEATELPHGTGWEVTLEGDDSEENSESETPENSPFSVLKDLDLFDEEEE